MSIHYQTDEQHLKSRQHARETSTNDLDYPTAERSEKAFLQVRAQFALVGHALYRSDPQDGAVAYWTERAGMAKSLATLEAARNFLVAVSRRQRHG